MTQIEDNGIIEQDGKGFVVKVKGKPYVSKIPGVTCENPGAPDAELIHVKRFDKKRIYMPGEYQRAVQENLVGRDVIVLGMNGYSALSDDQCRAWGVQPLAYESACEGILKSVCRNLWAEFPGISMRFADGASNELVDGRMMGVDSVLLKVAKDLNILHLGHSCPKFMFYVKDDEEPVFVANTQAEYADAFISSLHVLIAANGRMQAFQHDIQAVFNKLKHFVPVNVLRSISTTGGPPAIGPKGQIEDAVAAFEQRVHVAQRAIYGGCDPYKSMVGHVKEFTTSVVRSLISPERAFGEIA
jgi:hypothetical protein